MAINPVKRRMMLKVALKQLENIKRNCYEFAFKICFLCQKEICIMMNDVKCHPLYPICINYFQHKAREEGKYYWDVVKEHLKQELEKIEGI